MDLTRKPKPPATTIHAPAMARATQPTRITTGSWDRDGGRFLAAGRRFAAPAFPADPFRLVPFFFWPEREVVFRPRCPLVPRGERLAVDRLDPLLPLPPLPFLLPLLPAPLAPRPADPPRLGRFLAG